MARLLPRMALEPPAGYVAFVERHLEPLRRDALRIVDDDDDADGVSSAVLTDVAIRWRRFELLRTWLGRGDPAAAYLPLAFARRSAEWKPPPGEIEVEVFGADEALPPLAVVSTSAATDRAVRSAVAAGAYPSGASGASGAGAGDTARASAAVRIARVRPPPLVAVSALAEAAIAWWHAYETHVRHRRIAAATLGFVVVMIMVRLHNQVATYS